MKRYLQHFLMACLLLSGSAAVAGDVSAITGILRSAPYSPVHRGSSVEIHVDSAAAAADYNVRDLVSLYFDQHTDTFLLNRTVVSTRLSVYMYDKAGTAITPVRTEHLTVSSDNHYNQQTIDRATLKLKGGYKLKVVIDSIYINGDTSFTLPRFVYIESEIHLDRYFNFSSHVNTAVSDISITAVNSDCSTDNSTDELLVNWDLVPGAEEYQLEWTYVNNYGATSGTYYSASALTADFKHNSTRVTTADNNYKITLSYEKGYILCRVRAVGRDYLHPSVSMYSVWSSPDAPLVSAVPSGARYLNSSAQESNKNWQYSATYAEEGKKKEVISYFDGSLHNRQSVTKINSDNNVIVGETIYDYQGRPAVNVLPTPVTAPECDDANESPALKYYPKYNRNMSDSVYSKYDFDRDSDAGVCNPYAPGMDTTSGSSLYYSGNNPDKTAQQAFVPDAELYPFSQVEYTPDNTGRIRSQSGVGKTFQLGGGHETKYLYSQPNQIELDRMFGSEAGDASHYKKNTVIDANGQVSVSYMNQEGKTIATALAGNPPTDSSGVYMDSLASSAGAATALTVDLFNKHSDGSSLLNRITPLQDGIEFSTQLTVGYNSTYSFNYNLSVSALSDSCLLEGLCMSCIYDLNIKVTDECGTDLTHNGTHDGLPIAKRVGHLDPATSGFTMTCGSPSGTTLADSVILDLAPGTYTVSKVLTLNTDARDFYVHNYLDTTYNSCVQTLNDFVAAEIAGLDTSACYNSCAACAAALGTKDDFVSSGRGTELQYDMMYEQCLAPCKEPTLCETSLEMMYIDMSPGGQYGSYQTDAATGNITSTDRISVFNTNNKFNGNTYTGEQNWKHPHIKINGTDYGVYVDDDGNRNVVYVTLNADSTTYTPAVDNPAKVYTEAATGELYTYPENLKYLNDFIPRWNQYYAHSLVLYHPEYVYYVACSDHGKLQTGDAMTSDAFDSLLVATETFADAVTNGFIRSNYDSIAVTPDAKLNDLFTQSGSHLYDPFFTSNGFGLSYIMPNGVPITHSHTAIRSAMQARYGNYMTLAGVNYSMVQIAAYLARCGNNFNSLPTGACMAFGTDYYTSITAGYAHKNDSIRDREWNLFKTYYLSEKRKAQFDRMDFYAKYYNWTSSNFEGGCNSCIGNAGYNLFSSGMNSPYLWGHYTPPYPALAPGQDCGVYTWTYYTHAAKRFISPSNTGLDAGSVPEQIYEQTGQCPIAYQLQMFLNGMAQDSLLNSSSAISMNMVSAFGPDLYTALNAGTEPSTFINYQWNNSISGSTLTAQIRNPVTNVNACTVTLNIGSTPISSFSQLIGLQNLSYDHISGGLYYFKATALYTVGDTATATASITGSSCINIRDCNFAPTCTANPFASDMANLMTVVAMRGKIGTTTAYNVSRDSLISPFITATIKATLGTPNSTLMWKYTSSTHRFDLYDSTNTGNKLAFTIVSATPNVAPGLSYSAFTAMRSDYNNLFNVKVMDSTGVLLTTIEGRTDHILSGDSTGISMGECGFPDAPECTTTEHHVRRDLEQLLSQYLTHKPFNSSSSLSSFPAYTSLLQGYLDAEDTITTTTSVVNDTLESYTIQPNKHDCSLSFSHPLGIAFDSLTAVTNLTGSGSTDAQGNYHDFYFIGMYRNGGSTVTDTVRGTSCWPLKNCNHCDSTTTAPRAMDSTVANIPQVYTGWATTPPATIDAVDTSICMSTYHSLLSMIHSYNLSAYAAHHHTAMDETEYADSTLFMRAGLCHPCAQSYISYLSNYVSADSSSALPLPDDIDHSGICKLVLYNDNATVCRLSYDNYSTAVSAYNTFITTTPVSSLHYPHINSTLDMATFMNRYCNCGDKFVANLRAIIRGDYRPDSATVAGYIDLDKACTLPACIASHPDSAFSFPPMTYSPNPCVQQMLNIAVTNAQNDYQQYVDSLTTYIASRYTEHCLHPLENFGYRYTEKEFHFTLYYYDQAGNLVKTIPPEGVQLLDIHDTADAAEVQIRYDRDHNQQHIYTSHRMPTNYEYNSLNQLVYQDMPDHDKMNLLDYDLPNGLDSRFLQLRTHFVNASRGYTSGYIDMGSGLTRGYAYSTDDGGRQWHRLNGTVSSDINDVCFASATVGFAAGSNAVILKTTDGGNSWDAKNLYNTYTHDLSAICFSSATQGVVAGDHTAGAFGVYYTNNAGSTWTAASGSFANNDTVTALSSNGSNRYYATVKNNGTGKIYVSTDTGHTWSASKVIRANDLVKVQYVNSGSLAFAVGADGTLLRSTASGSASWQLVSTGITKAFRDISFKNANEGVAIIDSVSGKGQLYKTFDGGRTWELLSAPGDYYTSMQSYDHLQKLFACGENGLISKVVMTAPPFAVTTLNRPSYVNDLASADAVYYSGNPQTVAVGSNDTIYYSEASNSANPEWIKVKTTPSVASADAHYKKVIVKDTTANVLKGVMLTQNGKVYAFSKNNTDVFTFSIAAVQNLSMGSISSYYFNDIASDAHNSSTFYAYDTISKRAFKGTVLATGHATLRYLDTVTVQHGNVVSLAVDTLAGNLLMAGSKGNLWYKATPNSTTGSYNSRSYTVQPVQLNDVSVAPGAVYAVGNDGSTWSSNNNGGSWRLLNSGTAVNLNAIRSNAAGISLIAADNGTAYYTTSSDSLHISLSAVSLGTTDNLTSIALSDSNAYIGTSGGRLFHMPNITTGIYSNVNVSGMTQRFNAMAFPASSALAYAGGAQAAMYQCINSNSARVNELFLPQLSADFATPNDGYLLSAKGDIRHTTDGGQTWQLILPGSTIPDANYSIHAIKANQAVILGTNVYFGVVNNNTSPSVVTIGFGQTASTLLTLDQNDLGYGVVTGTKRAVYTITATGSTFIPNLVDVSGVAPAGSPTDYAINAVHVFRDNSFIIAGEQSRIYYHNGSSYTAQMNYYAGAASHTLYDIWFHDDRTGYISGSGGLLLKCNINSNIGGGIGSTAGGIVWDTLTLYDPYHVYTASAKANISIRSIDFTDRHNGIVGGISGSGNFVLLIDDNSSYYSTRFFYDKLGRMVVSQNTKQLNKTPQAFSYTLYDALGRITEVGEKAENSGRMSFQHIFGSYVNNMFNINTINDDSLSAWVSATGRRTEVTHTYYDAPVFSHMPIVQDNLRKRVSDVTYEDVYDGIDSTYQHATHYTYDIHGNVNTLLQDNPTVDVTGQRYKRIDYEYDLISGKVNRVIYQPDAPDLFIHKYAYDADNRITKVETSTDDVIYQTDAKYFYYAHGPLARVEYGKNQVQGVDYAYTLQGWIKGINSNTLNAGRDMGKDGYDEERDVNKDFARDAMGYTLNYYTGDYKAIDRLKWNITTNRFEAEIPGSNFAVPQHSLYNGNISAMATTITQPDTATSGYAVQTPQPLGNAYRYDQLNRLIESQAYTTLDLDENKWMASASSVRGGSGLAPYDGLYNNKFIYDGNGNILHQDRRDNNGVIFDSMSYQYNRDVNGKLVQNRLYHVNDAASSSAATDDIDDEGTFTATASTINTANNYGYDGIGNMTRDASEEIDSIKWTVYGKIKEIKRSSGSTKKNLKFGYDAGGNRVVKSSYTSAGVWIESTYYVRDAQGNVMGTYHENASDSSLSYKWLEADLYGSSRIGLTYPDKEMVGADTVNEVVHDTLNKRQYEFSNHLGNVLTVAYDHSIAVDSNADNIVDYHLADLASASDYSPFGAPLSGRGFSSEKYRYGFNGKEKDDEVKGNGNQQDYGMRIYDVRLSKFLSVDPLTKKYPELTPYQFASNTPIQGIDLDGNEISVHIYQPTNFTPKLGFVASTDHFEFRDAARNLLAEYKLNSEGVFNFYMFENRIESSYTYKMDGSDQLNTIFFGVQTTESAIATANSKVPDVQQMSAAIDALLSDGVAEEYIDPRPKVPNPFGKKGGILHQETTQKAIDEIEAKGNKYKQEVKINTPGQTKNSRYMDVAEYDAEGNLIQYHQVGKQNKNGTPISRERKAIEDVKNSGDNTPIEYHPYNKRKE